ncbi:MAG: hypothetical protein PF440_12045 [Thiomicrorhabdus sp.]|jgi:hypothetical protein|nr:hypothetical protein [Thiomicrorhabdus sp.]
MDAFIAVAKTYNEKLKMESEWQRILRRRKEGKCNGGKFRDVPKIVTDIELEFRRERQRIYQQTKKRYDYFHTGLIPRED